MKAAMVKDSQNTPKPKRKSPAKPEVLDAVPTPRRAKPASATENPPTSTVVLLDDEAEPRKAAPGALAEDDLDLAELAEGMQALGGLSDEAIDVLADAALEAALAPPDHIDEEPTAEPKARGRSTSLAKTDPLTQYMNEIRRYPLMSREQEHELAVEFQKTRNPVLARRLITSNLRLVVKIAHEYRRAYKNLLDLVQEGNLGLLQAVQKYDPHRGVKLSSYSAWWIRAYMLKFILNNWRLVKIGTTQAQRKLFFNLSKQREKLELAGIVPTNKALGESMNLPEHEVAEMQLRLAASETSLDTPVGREDEGGRSHVDLLEATNESRPDVSAESDEFRALLRSKLEIFEKTLTGREQTLFHERLMTDSPLTLQEVGERYDISRERARQIEARLLARLKVFLKKELGDVVQVAMGLD
jgi:RNA polymerase sigma-32 factor